MQFHGDFKALRVLLQVIMFLKCKTCISRHPQVHYLQTPSHSIYKKYARILLLVRQIDFDEAFKQRGSGFWLSEYLLSLSQRLCSPVC